LLGMLTKRPDKSLIMALSVFGLGKLGLPLAALFARSGLQTVGIDIDAVRVEQLRRGTFAFPEVGLDEIVADATPLITYTTKAEAASATDASIILVSTDGRHPGLSSHQVENACLDLCAALRARASWRYHLIAIGSTLMPGTMANVILPLLERELGRRAGTDFGVAYVPEFVAQGEIAAGFQSPPLLLIGSDDAAAGAQAAELYRRIVAPHVPVRLLSTRDVELSKLASNLFLSMKISFANSIAQIADKLGGADLDAIAEALSFDKRIGTGLLRGGAPYGGPCLPRDVDSFLRLARSLNTDAPLARAAAEVNAFQYDIIEEAVLKCQPRCVAVLGLSFKPGTPVTIGSPAFEFIRRMGERSIRSVAFDPLVKAREAALATFGDGITCYGSLEECVPHADTILICNPDPSFANLASVVPADRHIVDPWGILGDFHPGLVRPGRTRDGTPALRAFVCAQ